MISKANEFIRRILHFPAIRPCESVSLSTLLSSLIKLAHSICRFKSKTFFTNKNNARVSINLMEALLVLLEEIQNTTNPPTLKPNSTFLCLSELHFIFQKLLFLLEDCSRDDAKLWMLMKSEKASTHFRELMRAISVALDVLDFPLAESDVVDDADGEVQELVDLVRKQALRAKFDVGKDDRRAVRTVLRIINRFESGIAPQSSDLERVLGYLGIKTWNECDDEIKLLEAEKAQEYGTSQRRDVQFLSTLIAFLIFCRCTVFVDTDDVRKSTTVLQQSRSDQMIITCLNHDDFRCPITLEIMADPVTISTGHTYDRSSISKWFGSGNRTCPITGEKLVCLDLVPNLAVKRLIKQFYCDENGIILFDGQKKLCEVNVMSLAADQAMKLVANFLVYTLLSGTSDERNKASYEIRLLTKTSVFNRSCLVEADAIPPLLSQLISVLNPASQENAMAGLFNLSKHSKGKKIIVENGGLSRIVDILNNGIKIECRHHAAGTLFYLASFGDYRQKIGRITGSIPGLMALLRGKTVMGKKNALAAILGLIMDKDNHWRVLSAGLVPVLVRNILLEYSCETEDDDLVADSLAVLATLAEKLDGAMAVLSGGILPVILEIILSSSKSKAAKEYCVSLLLALCVNGGADVVRLLVKNSSLMASLYSVLADGSTRSSRKAGSLIGILHAFNEKSSFSSASSSSAVRVW